MIPTIDKRKTGINIRKIMDQRGITVKEIQQYLGLGSVQSIYHWLNGLSLPTIDNLYALSELFQVPIDTLVCGNKTKRWPQYVPVSGFEGRMYVYYTKLAVLRAA